MKKLFIGAVLALFGATVPVASTFALDDPTQNIPACTLGLDPTLQYEPAYFVCEPYTNNATGVSFNAINIDTPKL